MNHEHRKCKTATANAYGVADKQVKTEKANSKGAKMCRNMMGEPDTASHVSKKVIKATAAGLVMMWDKMGKPDAMKR